MRLFRTPGWLLLAALLMLAPALSADSKAETMKQPADTTRSAAEPSKAELDEKYKAALEQRVAEEQARYEGSLTSLWMSNAAVWTVLMLFIVMQALSARKRAAELERLRAAREGNQG